VLGRIKDSVLGRLIKRYLESKGYVVFDTNKHYGRDGLFTVHNDAFRRDPAFQASYNRGVHASWGVDPQFEWRVHIALWAATEALRSPGDFVECGVNAGFMSSAIMQHLDWASLARRYYLIDTFSGPVMSKYSEQEINLGRVKVAQDALAAGSYRTNLDDTRSNFGQWPNAIIVQGGVPEVLPTLELNEIAFLHLDLNCAEPECAALKYFWPKLSPGGFVLLDDYCYTGYEWHTETLSQVARSLGAEVLSLPTGQGLIRK
jgi:Macrocin-O-methyltransferase (TylF)